MKRLARFFLLVGVLAVASALLVYRFVATEMDSAINTELSLAVPRLLRIEPGANALSIGRQFESEGWINDARLFALHARLSGNAQQIQAGSYMIAAGDSIASVLARMVAGDTATFTITFIEGSRFEEMLAALAAHKHIQFTMNELSPDEIIAALDIEEPHLEGLFFPSTYEFTDQTTDRQLLKRAYLRMQSELAAAWSMKQTKLPLDSPYEALILASIIEKETGAAEEREEIAGVFVRRLRKGMKLQTDPTVIYGLGDQFNGNLTRAHLRGDTPYNTYTRHGLPPTPIALPGRAAIRAAVSPASGKSLYFVARGDGTHYFSNTLTEHNRAVRKFQLKQ